MMAGLRCGCGLSLRGGRLRGVHLPDRVEQGISRDARPEPAKRFLARPSSPEWALFLWIHDGIQYTLLYLTVNTASKEA